MPRYRITGRFPVGAFVRFRDSDERLAISPDQTPGVHTADIVAIGEQPEIISAAAMPTDADFELYSVTVIDETWPWSRLDLRPGKLFKSMPQPQFMLRSFAAQAAAEKPKRLVHDPLNPKPRRFDL